MFFFACLFIVMCEEKMLPHMEIEKLLPSTFSMQFHSRLKKWLERCCWKQVLMSFVKIKSIIHELESVEKQCTIYFVLHCVYRADILLFKWTCNCNIIYVKSLHSVSKKPHSALFVPFGNTVSHQMGKVNESLETFCHQQGESVLSRVMHPTTNNPTKMCICLYSHLSMWMMAWECKNIWTNIYSL